MQSAASEPQVDNKNRVAIAGFIFIATAVVLAQWAVQAMQSPQTGWDFPVFYIAGRLPMHLLYDRTAFEAFWQNHLVPLGVPHWAPYVRLSIFSFPLRLISALPYPHALWLWLAAGLTAYLGSAVLIIRRFHLPGFLLPTCAAFFPALGGIIGGADNGFLFLALVLAILLLERRRDRLAAVALTASLCKFNLIFLIPLLLLLRRRYVAFAWFGIGVALAAGVSITLTPVREYVTAVIDAETKTAGFYPVGLRGFSVAVGQPWCYPVLAVGVFVLCCWLMARLELTDGFCVAIVGGLLISPYVCWYDSTLLVLPITVVFARAGTVVRIVSMVVLAAVPLWEHGGGNNGPIGFMHVGVEALLLGYFFYNLRPISSVTLVNTPQSRS